MKFSKSVTQEESMGCAVACVAFALGIFYKNSKRLFDKPENALTKGYYCRDIIRALSKKNLNYSFSKVSNQNSKLLNGDEAIVFIRRSKKYPAGHYLIKTNNGWMNPWINLPNIASKSGFQKKLPGEPQWIIYPVNYPRAKATGRHKSSVI